MIAKNSVFNATLKLRFPSLNPILSIAREYRKCILIFYSMKILLLNICSNHHLKLSLCLYRLKINIAHGY